MLLGTGLRYQSPVFYYGATVHYYFQAGVFGYFSTLWAYDAELCPEDLCVYFCGFSGDVGDVLRSTEYIDYVDLARDFLKRWVASKAEYFVDARVDRDHVVAVVQEVDSYAIAWPEDVWRESDYGDISVVGEDGPELFVAGDHDAWLWDRPFESLRVGLGWRTGRLVGIEAAVSAYGPV
jgi:hypothetical protein